MSIILSKYVNIDTLKYLWVQLDQNVRAKDSKTPDITPSSKIPEKLNKRWYDSMFSEPFDGGFNIMSVQNVDGSNLSHTINQTMMRINLPEPLASGEKFQFKISWWYNINNHVDIIPPFYFKNKYFARINCIW